MLHRNHLCVAVLLLLLAGCLPVAARTWQVRPAMSLAEIQDVFDRAADGDKLLFHKGMYDFSAGPFLDLYTDGGAIVIRDKSLNVQGVGDVLIKGRESELNSSGEAVRGITAFLVSNPGHDKDVSFSNMKFDTFMFAITATNTQSISPLLYLPCARDIAVDHCAFANIQRNAIALTYVTGNIAIRNNRIAATRFGMYISWYWTAGHQVYQSENTLMDISGNVIEAGRGGMVLQNASSIRIADNHTIGTGSSRQYGIYVEGLKTGGWIGNNRCEDFLYGIVVAAGWRNDPLYPPFEQECRQAVVTDNMLTRISDTGVFFASGLVHDCQVMGNRISLFSSGFAGIYCDGYANRFENNVIVGSGAYAIGLFGADYSAGGGPACFAHDNDFFINSVAGFLNGDAHYYLDHNTHDNHLYGICSENATVIDNGSHNEISCLAAPGNAAWTAGAPPRISAPGKACVPVQECLP